MESLTLYKPWADCSRSIQENLNTRRSILRIRQLRSYAHTLTQSLIGSAKQLIMAATSSYIGKSTILLTSSVVMQAFHAAAHSVLLSSCKSLESVWTRQGFSFGKRGLRSIRTQASWRNSAITSLSWRRSVLRRTNMLGSMTIIHP